MEPTFCFNYFDNQKFVVSFYLYSSKNYFLTINNKEKKINKNIELRESTILKYDEKYIIAIGYIENNRDNQFWYPTFFKYDNFF